MSDRLAAAMAELVNALREEAAPASSDVPNRLLSVSEASAALGGVGRSLLYGEISAGRLRSIRVGRRRLIPSSAVAEYIGRRAS